MPRKIEEPPPSRPAYFWWLLANALALCFAVISWFVCLDVFGNPDVPRNYRILKKLGRAPVLKKYNMNDVPNGNALSPKELYSKYFGLDDKKRESLNALLLKNYLTNFDRPLLITYAEGQYEVRKVRKLGPSDFFSSGFVVRGQSLVKPDDFTKPMPYPVLIEYIFPTSQGDASKSFKEGDILDVKKSPNCAVVIHVSKTTNDNDPCLLLTVVPILYEKYSSGDSPSFLIEPPSQLRLDAGLPVIKKP